MELDNKYNYIVSGLERSGTSMLMQILEAGNIPVAYDDSRLSDDNNPKGYYELFNGKIINKLEKDKVDLNEYKGKFIKVTSLGLQHLPKEGNYIIIYMTRNMEEIIDSTEIMTGKKVKRRKALYKSLEKLDIKTLRKALLDFNKYTLPLNYNNILEDPRGNIEMILEFLELPEDKIDDMIKVVDEKLYRNRHV